MASKFYAVRKGLTPGIYRTWDECKAMVHGVAGAEYKSFPTLEEAESYMGREKKADIKSEGFSFVDGSFNVATGVYGYGGFIEYKGNREIITGSGNDAEMASMRNVAGEVLGSMAAIERAIELGMTSLDIYYDYSGIEMWATGEWKRNKKGTIAYYEYVQSVKDKISLNFVKVKGHSGVEGNEEADRLAKKAVGIE
ncbi:MAG: ribonuclease H family protein [Lachnospira sp.]|nr:ribonuclease H family protein [Lachnospira sp.]